MTEAPKIYAAIAGVMSENLYVKRGSAGQGTGVLYDEVIAIVRPAMTKHGIISFPKLIEQSERETKKGAYIYQATYEITYVCTLDGSSITVNASAHAQDGGDKAPGKAMTYATKSAHVKVFGLETGINDESRAEENNIDIISDEQYGKIYHLMHENNVITAKGAKILKAFNITNLQEISPIKYNQIMEKLK